MSVKDSVLIVALVGLLTGCTTATKSGSDCFTNWPAGTSPAEVGKRMAENFAARKLEFESNPKRQFVVYPEACAWYGSLTVAQLTGDAVLQARLVRKFDSLLTAEGTNHISPQAHVDFRVI